MSGPVLRLQLFFISYVPLALIFCIRAVPSMKEISGNLDSLWTSTFFLLIAVLGLLLCLRLLYGSSNVTGPDLEVINVQDQGANAAAYLATYLFPFILFEAGTWQIWASYGVYMIILALVTIRSNLILINPTLYAFGRQIAQIEFRTRKEIGDESGAIHNTALLICRKLPQEAQSVRVLPLADGYLEK